MQRDTYRFPCLYERPINRADEEMLSPPTSKRVFDFREVVEIIQDERFQVSGFRFQVSGFRFQVSGFRFQVDPRISELETLNLKLETHFVRS